MTPLQKFPWLAPRVGAFSLTFVVGLFACPFLVIAMNGFLPRVPRLFLFFWPQQALAPYGFTFPSTDETRTYLDGGWNYVIAGVFWLLVGIGLSWLLRRKPVFVTAIAALPVAFAVGIAAEALLDLFDIGIYYESP